MVDFQLTIDFLVIEMDSADTVFVVLNFSFQVWTLPCLCSPTVAMYLLSTPSTACQCPSTCIIARLSAYAHSQETVLGKSEMEMLKRRGAGTDPMGRRF